MSLIVSSFHSFSWKNMNIYFYTFLVKKPQKIRKFGHIIKIRTFLQMYLFFSVWHYNLKAGACYCQSSDSWGWVKRNGEELQSNPRVAFACVV